MKKIALLFSIFMMTPFLWAQTYSVKLYYSYYGDLAVENLAEDAEPLELPKDEAAKYMASASNFSEIVLKASSPMKIFNKESQYTEDHYVEKTSFREFTVEAADGGKSAILALKSSDKASYTARNDGADNYSAPDQTLDIKKKVRLDVPSLLYLKTNVAEVNDSTPILGDIPLLGRYFQSKGLSKSSKLLWVVVSEVKE